MAFLVSLYFLSVLLLSLFLRLSEYFMSKLYELHKWCSLNSGEVGDFIANKWQTQTSKSKNYFDRLSTHTTSCLWWSFCGWFFLWLRMLLISWTVLFGHFLSFIHWKKQVPHNYFTFINILQSMGFSCVCGRILLSRMSLCTANISDGIWLNCFILSTWLMFLICVRFCLLWLEFFAPNQFMYANKKDHLFVWFISFGLKWTDRSYLHNNKWTAIFVMFISISTQIDDLSETKCVLLKNWWRI